MNMKKYVPAEIESKWQRKWESDKLYRVDLKQAKKPFYLLVEFPYSSGDLHIGHWFAFGVTDIYGRFKRMQGYDVFFPVGFDAFGLPAENAAIKRGLHPQDWTLSNVKTMTAQFKMMGAIHDWDHQVITCMPEYYKWNQWIFLKMLEKGIAYRGKTFSNWCPVDKTVLADENVEAGKCWRCGAEVIQKEVDQWFLKITGYADKLLWESEPEKIAVDWPKAVREGQNNWIGKSEGVLLKFKVKELDIEFEMYDSVPQTFMAQTFTVIAPEHPAVYELVKGTEHEKPVMEFIDKLRKKKAANKFEIDRNIEGIFTGRYLQYTPTGESIPIWVASFVIYDYGTGVVNCSAHDERDFAFAKKYDLPLHPVMFPKDPIEAEKVRNLEYCYHHDPEALLEEPIEFKGRKWGEVRPEIINFIEKKGYGIRKTQYHLHDWTISRQRYWGTPIPIINCPKCGSLPVPYEDLPVELPYKVDHQPQGEPPLATAKEWMQVDCPKCKGKATREPETMDGFVDNSWYFYRYLSPHLQDQIFDKELVKKWIPLNIYFGGAEHTLGHTMYSRFFTKFFHDTGLVDFDEYALKRFNHGVILGPDGSRMSKSKGNIVNPDDQVKDFGADAVRMYLGFIGPYDIVAPWNPGGIQGIFHFLQRVWALQDKLTVNNELLTMNDLRLMHKTIKKVSEDLENIKFNTAIASLMEWLNHLSRKELISTEEYKIYLLLLAPFAPHMTEELWEIVMSSESAVGSKTNNWSIHKQSLPKFDSKYLEEEDVSLIVQVNGKVRDMLLIQKDILSNKEVIEKMALDSKKVQNFLGGKKPMKTIYVQGRVLNIVV